MPKRKKDKEAAPTIIIKKKLYDGDGGHHGGVWKIAYADFMTAMMTFFLVMWLINSSSKEKITQLASYFNPVKLSDKTPPSKGVRDDEAGGTGDQKIPGKKTENKPEKPEKPGKKAEDAQQKPEEENLFRNPFGVLTQLASQAEGEMAVVISQSSAGSGGAAHDPFITDPVVSQPVVQTTPPGGRDALERAKAAGAGPAKVKVDSASEDKNTNANANANANADANANAKPTPDSSEPKPSHETQVAATQLAKEIGRLTDALPKSFRPNITTKATAEGVLLSLTDDLTFSMFKIASAEPSPQLVLVLEKIGNLINKQAGKLVVRGHTDGRPYSGDAHGNWRLSINRANMAYYMLLRAKVDDTRFLAVEGYADRNLRNKTDPLAAENRRIEILIKGAES